jgi:hypothetical protein
LAEIGYYVKWTTTGQNTLPTLHRFFVNPDAGDPASGGSNSAGPSGVNSNYLIYKQQNWLSNTLLDNVSPADQDHGYVGLFAENVVGLWVRPYGLDGVELTANSFDSRAGYTCSFDVPGQARWKDKRYLPAMVKVSVAQLDANYQSRLGPVGAQVQKLANTSHTAAEFLSSFRATADTSPALRSLLPGLQIYSTDIPLANSR